MKKNSPDNKKFKTIVLHNGVNVAIVDGRDSKIAEINISGTKKKLSQEDIDELVNALMSAKKWLNDEKL